jgi:PAS domain S-box-containing protein
MAVLPVAVLSLSIAIFFTLRSLENQNAKASFDIVAEERFDALETNVTLTLRSLVSLGAFYDGSDDVERAHFARFAKDLLARDNAIQAMEWIPRTPFRLRADRENAAQRDGFPAFQFTERLPQGQLARARGRDEYFPVFFVEPLKGNEKALGFDLASDAVRNAALRRSAATGSLAATGRVRLVQETGEQFGFLVFRPVYRGGVQPSSVSDRRERLLGFVLAVFRVGDIVEKAGAVASAASGLHVAIFDADAQPGERLLYPKSAPFDGVADLPDGFRAIREIPVAGRRWVMAAYPSPRAFRPVHWSSESALAAGILLTTLLGGYLHLNHRRRSEIEQRRGHLEELVQSRTTALEAKEQQLRLLLESTAEAIYGIDLKGQCTFCNPACLRLLGYERAEDLLGKNMHVEIHHSHPDQTIYPESECQIFRAFKKGEGTHATDEVLWRADGTSFPAEYWSHPQRRGNDVVGAVVTFVDITQRKQFEKELRESQDYVTALLAAIPAGVVVIDAETHCITDANAFALTQMGREREQVIGKTCHGFLCPAERGSCPITDLHQVVDHSERSLLRADGSRMPILKSVRPLVRQGRNYLVEAFGDLTDHKRTQADLEKAKEAAEAADRAKSVFLANMSHEIRTPMNAVLGYAQLMLRDPSLGGEAKKNLTIINRSGEHLLSLINDILVMSKIEAGRMELNPVRFDLATLVTDLAAMFRLRAEAKGLRLEVHAGGDVARPIVADQGKIREVLINLLGNAVKFTEAGSIQLGVSVAPRSGHQLELSIQVEDTGVGIPATEQSKLFRPFVQTQSGLASQGGTGLGLAISREFVRLMGGEITVSSEIHQGSTFRFTIPVQVDTVHPLAAQPAPGRVIGFRPGQPAAHVLIVDDQPHARGWLSELLKSVGFEVREADRGEVAIRLWQEWKPQLILMDIQMPGMNGLEASRTIKAEAHGNPPVIIALTASVTEQERDNAMRSGGMDDFLAKPCREGELLEKLRVHLNLDYRYADEEKGPEMNGCAAPGPVADAQLLAELPMDWIDQLHDAVRNGQKDRLDELIQRIETLDTRAARSLQEVADRYEYDVLAGWFEQAAQTRTAKEAERI